MIKMEPKNYNKINRWKGEGKKYWCSVCNQHHVMYSKIGENHRRYSI